MSITSEKKLDLIKKFQSSANDTGSSEVQVAILSERIKNLTEHFKIHKKDNHGRRGLFMLVGQRKRLLKYLQRTDLLKYQSIVKSIGLRA